MFDKHSLLKRLRELPFSEEEYWVVAGGAMVLHGFRPHTSDIDQGCSTLLADKLEQQGYAVSRYEDGTRRIVVSLREPALPQIRIRTRHNLPYCYIQQLVI